MKRIKKKIWRLIKKGARKAAQKAIELRDSLVGLWDLHLAQMLHDPGYAVAFRDLSFAAVDLFLPKPIARYIADQILTIYLAALRLTCPPRNFSHGWI